MSDVRVGIIGTGIGATHADVFQRVPGASVAAICSAQLARAQDLARRHDVPFATDDYRALLERVDAVVIATPPRLHAPMGLDAIAAGKHVFCEKPLATSLAEARALRDAATRAGVTHMVNLQLRYAPAYAHAHELIAAGALGRLMVGDARISMNPADYLRAPLWSDSKAAWFTDAEQAGGLLASSAGPHLIDLLLWLGGPITDVAARVAVAQPGATAGPSGAAITSEDSFVILAQLADGALATLRGVPVAFHGTQWTLELHGAAGSLVIQDDALRTGDATRAGLTPLTLPELPDARVAIAARFIAACAGGASPTPSFDDGVAIQAVLDASLRAARSGEWMAVERA